MLRPTIRSILCATILAVATAGTARADGAAADATNAAALAGAKQQRQKVRADLDRVNGQIDTLKREKRSLGDDYRLRGLMADAEALARKLNEIDARLAGSTRVPSPDDSAASGKTVENSFQPPQAKPFDDRADLEAKADILSDQARRLNGQANTLAGRVATLRGRQELRRRAGQLERDPFAPLERPARVRAGGSSAKVAADAQSPREGVTGSTGSGSPTTGVTGPGAGPGPTTLPPTGAATTPGGTTTDSSFGVSAQVGTPHTSGTPLSGPAPATGSSIDIPGSVAAQFRGVLDSSTLAEIRRLESPGSPAASLQAMERALTALRARAAELDGDATTLRTRARAGSKH